MRLISSYSARSTRRVARRKPVVEPGHSTVFLPPASWYQLLQPPVDQTVRDIRCWRVRFHCRWARAVGCIAVAPTASSVLSASTR